MTKQKGMVGNTEDPPHEGSHHASSGSDLNEVTHHPEKKKMYGAYDYYSLPKGSEEVPLPSSPTREEALDDGQEEEEEEMHYSQAKCRTAQCHSCAPVS